MTSASIAAFGTDIDEGEGLRVGTRSPSLKMTDATEMSFDGAGDVSVGRILTADELARSLNVSTSSPRIQTKKRSLRRHLPTVGPQAGLARTAMSRLTWLTSMKCRF